MGMKKIVVFEDNRMDDINESPDAFMKFWQDKIDLIPAEYRDSARVELKTSFHYDYQVTSLEIFYLRPETKEEKGNRERLNLSRLEAAKAKELDQLAALKLKYET